MEVYALFNEKFPDREPIAIHLILKKQNWEKIRDTGHVRDFSRSSSKKRYSGSISRGFPHQFTSSNIR